MTDRLKENISIIKQHNERGLPVKHITKGKKYELEVIDEIVEDVSLIIEKMENERLIEIPCKIGDTVYPLYADSRFRAFIEKIEINANELLFCWVQYDVGVDCTECWDEDLFTVDDIGKTVFLDETEYLIALKERERK